MTLLLKFFWRNIITGNQLSKTILGARSLSNNSELTCARPADAVMVSIKTAPSPSDVLTAVQKHLPTMSHKHLLQALRTIFEFQKETSPIKPTEELIKDPAFSVLCQNFKKQAPALDVNDAIEATKILSYFQLPVDSLIVQTMLQLIRCNINYISIRQIMFLDFLLGKFSVNNHLVDALQLALPLVFQIHLPLELDQDDLPLLKDMLYFCCCHNLPDRCINNIVTGLLLHSRDIDVQTAKSVVWSLCEGNCTAEIYPTRAKLLNICFDILAQQIDELNYDDLLRTIAKLKSRIVEKHPEFYQEALMDAVADYVVRNDVDFEKSLLIARVLSRIAHTHLGIVENLCQQVVSDPMTLTSARTNLLFGFINCLSNNNYTPEHTTWIEIQRQLSLNAILDATNIALPWTKFTLELASLGHFEDRILKRVFSPEFLNQYLYRENNILDYLQLLTLYEAVKTFHGGNYVLPDGVLEKAKSLYPMHAVTKQLAEGLGRGLGSQKYVVKNVVLPNGIIADTLICLKGGYPLEIHADNGDKKIPIEELQLPENALVVCIMNFNQGAFSVNSNRLRGTFRLVLDILEKQGYVAVPLNVNEWYEAPAHERTPYLMREVGYKCGEIGIRLCAS